MIVLTSVTAGRSRSVLPGDRLILSNERNGVREVILEEEITEAKTVDYWCSFRFAKDDGTCVGFHLCGFFGNRKELPPEIKEAVRVEDLTPEQYGNFVKSVGIQLI